MKIVVAVDFSKITRNRLARRGYPTVTPNSLPME